MKDFHSVHWNSTACNLTCTTPNFPISCLHSLGMCHTKFISQGYGVQSLSLSQNWCRMTDGMMEWKNPSVSLSYSWKTFIHLFHSFIYNIFYITDHHFLVTFSYITLLISSTSGWKSHWFGSMGCRWKPVSTESALVHMYNFYISCLHSLH